MPGTRPGMTRLPKVPDFIGCILSQTLRSAPLRASRRMRHAHFRALKQKEGVGNAGCPMHPWLGQKMPSSRLEQRDGALSAVGADADDGALTGGHGR